MNGNGSSFTSSVTKSKIIRCNISHMKMNSRVIAVILFVIVVGTAFVYFWMKGQSATQPQADTQKKIDYVRSLHDLPASKLTLVTSASGSTSLETRDGKVLLKDVSKRYVVSVNILLWPDEGNAVYVIIDDWPWGGQVWKVDLTTGTETQLPDFNRAKGGLTYTISPAENALIQPAGTAVNPKDVNSEEESFAFDVMDLSTGVIRQIAKLPSGYSYAYNNAIVNPMGSSLYPLAQYAWDDANHVRAKVYARSTPLTGFVGSAESRKAVGEVVFSLEQKVVSEIIKQ